MLVSSKKIQIIDTVATDNTVGKYRTPLKNFLRGILVFNSKAIRNGITTSKGTLPATKIRVPLTAL